jgi:hypothetical protein
MAAMKQTALQATAIRLPHTKIREQTADTEGKALVILNRVRDARFTDTIAVRYWDESQGALYFEKASGERVRTMGIRMEVKLTDGYQQRFTSACLAQIGNRKEVTKIEDGNEGWKDHADRRLQQGTAGQALQNRETAKVTGKGQIYFVNKFLS